MRRLDVLAVGPSVTGSTATTAIAQPASAGRTTFAAYKGYPTAAPDVNDLRHSGTRTPTTSGAILGRRIRTPDSLPTS